MDCSAEFKLEHVPNVPYRKPPLGILALGELVDDDYKAHMRQCVDLYLPNPASPELQSYVNSSWTHPDGNQPASTDNKALKDSKDSKDSKGSNGAPILVFVHGGGFASGARSQTNIHQMMKRFCRTLKCVCVSVGYRLCRLQSVVVDLVLFAMTMIALAFTWWLPASKTLEKITWLLVGLFFLVVCVVSQYMKANQPNNPFPTAIYDVADASKWVYENAEILGGDRNKMIWMGHSAGAHLATVLYASPEYWARTTIPRSSVAAIVGISGVYSAERMHEEIMSCTLGKFVFGRDCSEWDEHFPVELTLKYPTRAWPPVLLVSAEFDYGLRLHARAFFRALKQTKDSQANVEWTTVRNTNHFSIICFVNHQHHKIAEFVESFIRRTLAV